MSKSKVSTTIRLRARTVVMEAVENAISAGVKRAFKHTDTPDRDAVVDHVNLYVGNALDELLDFGEAAE